MRTIFTDLDGTLLTINSMKLFMRWLPEKLLMRGHVMDSALAFWFIGLRVCRLCSHRYMKWHLSQIAIRDLAPSDWDQFAALLKRHVNPEVMAYIAEAESVCLITAAMEEYASPFAAMLGFDFALATHFTSHYEDYEELRGKAKLDAIFRLPDVEVAAFLTDHYDDLPVANCFPDKTLLVNPSTESVKRFAAIGVEARLRGRG